MRCVAFAKDFSGKKELMRTYRGERTYGVDFGKWSASFCLLFQYSSHIFVA